MSETQVEHEITVAAPAADVYRLIAEVANWPRIFPPTVHVEHLEQGEGEERIRIWATANGEVRSWTSRRTLDAEARRITFRQEVSPAPVASMGGTWIIEPLGEHGSRVRLLHDYRAIDDDPVSLERITAAVDTNSRSELAALKSNVELAAAAEELTFTFSDSLSIEGPVEQAYEFLNAADRWAERLPHVASVRLDETTPGLQTLEMDTRTKDGSTHTTKSHRVCFAGDKIAYKQVTLPASLDLHTGCWTFQQQETGVLVTSQHTVVVNRVSLADVLGPDGDVATARKMVRDALGGNSRATLERAKAHVEAES
jgi:aromatase